MLRAAEPRAAAAAVAPAAVVVRRGQRARHRAVQWMGMDEQVVLRTITLLAERVLPLLP